MSASRLIRSLRAGIVAMTLVVVALILPALTSASHWDSVTRVEGNPGCGSGFNEAKAETNGTGTYSIDEGGFTATVTVGPNSTVSFEANNAVDQVIVKGGPPSHVYSYDPEVFEDDGLTAPQNGPDKRYGVSHVTLCWDEGNPPPTTTGTTTTTTTTTTTGTPPGEQQPPVQGTADSQTGQPAPQQGSAPQRAGQVARTAANARLRGPSRCVRAAYTVRVAGRGIRRVTFSVNGRHVRTLAGRSGRATYVLRLNALELGSVQRVSARVQFVASAQRAARTYRMRVRRCALQAVEPRFTG